MSALSHSKGRQAMTVGEGAPPCVLVLDRAYLRAGDRAVRDVALGIADGTIRCVGSFTEAKSVVGARAQVLRLPGATAAPGLVDAHLHLGLLAQRRITLDLSACASASAVAESVRRAAPPHDGWIRGVAWDDAGWSDAASLEALDHASPARPVLLERVDHHAVWINSEAARRAGLDLHGPPPAGGHFARGLDGGPSGVLLDRAADRARAALPAIPPAARLDALREVSAMCRRVGLTGVHDAATTLEDEADLVALDAAGELGLRVETLAWVADAAWPQRRAQGPRSRGLVRVRTAKLFLDGALGSRGAWLSAPYADAPGWSGLMLLPGPEALDEARAAASAGFGIAAHAIGDAAVSQALDLFAAVPSRSGVARRIEHAQVVRPVDRRRMAALGVVAVIQPIHAVDDARFTEARLGRSRTGWAHAWRALHSAGVCLALSSDAPIGALSPWAALRAARWRTGADGEPSGGWRPAQALSLRAAWRACSEGAALAAGDAPVVGTLSVGSPADVTVFDGDPFRDPRSAVRHPDRLVAADDTSAAWSVRGVLVAGRYLPNDA